VLVRVVSGALTPDAGLRPMQPSSTAKFRSSRQSFKASSPWVPQHQSITRSAHIHLGLEVRDRGVHDRAVGQPRGVAADAGRVWDESTARRTVSSDGFRACATPPS
jgi:hypothetical protein